MPTKHQLWKATLYKCKHKPIQVSSTIVATFSNCSCKSLNIDHSLSNTWQLIREGGVWLNANQFAKRVPSTALKAYPPLH